MARSTGSELRKVAGGAPTRRAFDHVLVIMFENQYRSYVIANPYMRQLARQGIQLGNFFGVMHPSQTNYIASIAGALCNVTTDDPVPLIDERTIVDLIEEAPGRLQWKAYMDSYIPQATPWTPQFTPQDAHPYHVKHNPFASFSTIVRNEARWRRVESEAAFFSDLLNGEFPEYAWFSPNVWNDGHWLNGTTPGVQAPSAGTGRPTGASGSRTSLRGCAFLGLVRICRRVPWWWSRSTNLISRGITSRTWPRPTTAPIRSTLCSLATASNPASKRKATIITACCGQLR